MKKQTILATGLATLILSFSLQSQAAVFMKYDGVKGESTARATCQTSQAASGRAVRAEYCGDNTAAAAATSPKTLKAPDNKPTALLLPAVQSAREAARRP